MLLAESVQGGVVGTEHDVVIGSVALALTRNRAGQHRAVGRLCLQTWQRRSEFQDANVTNGLGQLALGAGFAAGTAVTNNAKERGEDSTENVCGAQRG